MFPKHTTRFCVLSSHWYEWYLHGKGSYAIHLALAWNEVTQVVWIQIQKGMKMKTCTIEAGENITGSWVKSHVMASRCFLCQNRFSRKTKWTSICVQINLSDVCKKRFIANTRRLLGFHSVSINSTYFQELMTFMYFASDTRPTFLKTSPEQNIIGLSPTILTTCCWWKVVAELLTHISAHRLGIYKR